MQTTTGQKLVPSTTTTNQSPTSDHQPGHIFAGNEGGLPSDEDLSTSFARRLEALRKPHVNTSSEAPNSNGLPKLDQSLDFQLPYADNSLDFFIDAQAPIPKVDPSTIAQLKSNFDEPNLVRAANFSFDSDNQPTHAANPLSQRESFSFQTQLKPEPFTANPIQSGTTLFAPSALPIQEVSPSAISSIPPIENIRPEASLPKVEATNPQPDKQSTVANQEAKLQTNTEPSRLSDIGLQEQAVNIKIDPREQVTKGIVRGNRGFLSRKNQAVGVGTDLNLQFPA